MKSTPRWAPHWWRYPAWKRHCKPCKWPLPVPEALIEALSRILVNALDHGFANGRSGTLRLAARVDAGEGGEFVVITISDNGHGIAPEDLPKVFDPFFTTKSGMHGHVGLGLHVAYNHVTQRLKGQIHITSTLGEGTCVEIRLKK